jgi:hypothetical protein
LVVVLVDEAVVPKLVAFLVDLVEVVDLVLLLVHQELNHLNHNQQEL